MAGGGRITIETRNVTLDRGYATNEPEVAPGTVRRDHGERFRRWDDPDSADASV